MSIINYGALEEPIRKIEEVLDEFDNEEKALVLKMVNQRFAAKNQQHRINENLRQVPLKDLVKGFMKGDR